VECHKPSTVAAGNMMCRWSSALKALQIIINAARKAEGDAPLVASEYIGRQEEEKACESSVDSRTDCEW
jgi:hypothetical protein